MNANRFADVILKFCAASRCARCDVSYSNGRDRLLDKLYDARIKIA